MICVNNVTIDASELNDIITAMHQKESSSHVAMRDVLLYLLDALIKENAVNRKNGYEDSMIELKIIKRHI